MTRQREWQLRKKAEGVCYSCGGPRIFESTWCFRHYLLRLFARYGLPTLNHKIIRGKRRQWREQTIAFLAGRYAFIVAEGVPPDPPLWSEIGYSCEAQSKRPPHYANGFVKACKAMDRKAVREYAARAAGIMENATDEIGEAHNNCDTSFSYKG